MFYRTGLLTLCLLVGTAIEHSAVADNSDEIDKVTGLWSGTRDYRGGQQSKIHIRITYSEKTGYEAIFTNVKGDILTDEILSDNNPNEITPIRNIEVDYPNIRWESNAYTRQRKRKIPLTFEGKIFENRIVGPVLAPPRFKPREFFVYNLEKVE